MIRVFISQPKRDKTNEQIKTERKRAIDEIGASKTFRGYGPEQVYD